MLINFEQVILHNFLSYGHAEIDLSNKRYCLVSGINKNPRDNALSNGAGKSTWASAICWAIVGETIQGLTSNIKNINVDEDLCYVTLKFSVDGDNYVITRYKNPKSDLKIELNSKDISGKGIKESEAILASHLPDLTSQLIASIIILGQGLPCKFTSNSPSGRKEVLEKLSKSDFMIQDLKNRIANRNQVLSDSLRSVQNELISKRSNKELLESQISRQEKELTELEIPKDYDTQIAQFLEEINTLELIINKNKQVIEDSEVKATAKAADLNKILTEKEQALSAENAEFTAFTEEYLKRKAQFDSTILTLSSKIKDLKNIKDICPTCGQKIPNVIKPSTELEEHELAEAENELNVLKSKYDASKKEYERVKQDIESSYSKDISDINFEIKKVKEFSNLHLSDNRLKEQKLLEVKNSLNVIELEKKNHTQSLEKAKKTLDELKISVENLNKDILINSEKEQEINEHIKVLNQMSMLVKRDFRGFLLSNIINFINAKAKEYSQEIFGTNQLDFILDGNNIDISYCNKSFENLSGGEKQRVDLIIQFAIRDMMKQYLGFSSNILILDEIFDQLDILGCNNVLNMISNKLDDIESIFIISHRADELEIPYDCELIITKNEEGVSSSRWQ